MKKLILLIISLIPVLIQAEEVCNENLKLEDYMKQNIVKSKIEEISREIDGDKVNIHYLVNPEKYYTKTKETEFLILLSINNNNEKEYLNNLNNEDSYYLFINKETNILNLNECPQYIIKESELEEYSLPYRAINMFGMKNSFKINKEENNKFNFRKIENEIKENKINFKN